MNHCSRCSAAPAPVSEAGTLYMIPPLAHTVHTLRELLGRLDLPFSEPAANLLSVPLADGALRRIADSLATALSQAELHDTKSLVVDEEKTLTIADLAAIQPLSVRLARTRGEWFTELLRDDRLISHFHPIVRADEPQAVFAHECLVRGLAVDGGLIPPIRLYQAARDADLLFNLDRAARLTAIRCAAAHGLDAGDARLFINFNPTAIYDPRFCLRSTVAAIAENAFRPERIVFEIVESDQVEDLGHLVRIAEFYREAGFQIALDDLGAGYGSLNLLSALRPEFVKLDMHLIRGVDHDRYKAGIVRKLLEMAQDLGCETVAEGIETVAEWSFVREHGANYVQGYLFARPDSPPPRPRLLANSPEPAMASQ